MKKALSKRQAIILFACLIISFKLQRLPAFFSQDFGRDCYIAVAVIFLIDFLLLLLMCAVYKKLGDKTVFEYIKENTNKFVLVLFCIFTILFFASKSVIGYKQLHEFFANTLFNNLPWNYFGILFVFLLVLLIGNGLNNIARSTELYSYVMLFSVLAIVVLGVTVADYSRLLPVLDIDIPSKFLKIFDYAGWFLDSVLILFFAGNVKDDKKSVKPFIWTYIISAVFVIIGIMTFYAINEHMGGLQNNGLSSMTEYTLIGLGIGRPDWFLVLFVNMASILTTAMLLWFATTSLATIINKRVNFWLAFIVTIALYAWDWMIYQNLELGFVIATQYINWFMLAFAGITPIFILLIKKKPAKQSEVAGDE